MGLGKPNANTQTRAAASYNRPTMHSPFFGEFMGTMILILLGNGVVAAVLLKGSKAENAGWICITAGWAFAVVCGVLAVVTAIGAFT